MSDLDVALVTEGVKGVQTNADELSLQWGLRPGTVSEYDPTTGIASVVYDGDVATSILSISMIGNVTAGERIFGIRVPPSGNYVVGRGQGSGTYSSGVSAGTSTNSTSYVVTASQWGVAFQAPGSGKIICMIRSSTAAAASAQAWMSPHFRTGDTLGSGTLFQAASDNYALMLALVAGSDMGTQFEITGFTPGQWYNAELHHKTTTGTSFWSRREIIISPSN